MQATASLSFPALLRELQREVPPEKLPELQQIGARFQAKPSDRASVSVARQLARWTGTAQYDPRIP